jgi:hypothetical protein
MRTYTDSADAIKAYAEEVNFDYNNVDVTEHPESHENQRGGITFAFKNYVGDNMSIKIIHTWLDAFDVTFESDTKGSDTLETIYADELMLLLSSLRVALTGVTREEWSKIVFNIEEE